MSINAKHVNSLSKAIDDLDSQYKDALLSLHRKFNNPQGPFFKDKAGFEFAYKQLIKKYNQLRDDLIESYKKTLDSE